MPTMINPQTRRPRFSVTKSYGHELGLSACFRQPRAESHCRFLHGYAMAVKLTFSTVCLDENGWVIDFGALKPVKAMITELFDHKMLIAADDPELDYIASLAGMGLADVIVLENGVGCERFAAHIASTIHSNAVSWFGINVAARVSLDSVEVREHGGNSGIWSNA